MERNLAAERDLEWLCVRFVGLLRKFEGLKGKLKTSL